MEHQLDDRSTAQARVQMQTVKTIELQVGSLFRFLLYLFARGGNGKQSSKVKILSDVLCTRVILSGCLSSDSKRKKKQIGHCKFGGKAIKVDRAISRLSDSNQGNNNYFVHLVCVELFDLFTKFCLLYQIVTTWKLSIEKILIEEAVIRGPEKRLCLTEGRTSGFCVSLAAAGFG